MYENNSKNYFLLCAAKNNSPFYTYRLMGSFYNCYIEKLISKNLIFQLSFLILGISALSINASPINEIKAVENSNDESVHKDNETDNLLETSKNEPDNKENEVENIMEEDDSSREDRGAGKVVLGVLNGVLGGLAGGFGYGHGYGYGPYGPHRPYGPYGPYGHHRPGYGHGHYGHYGPGYGHHGYYGPGYDYDADYEYYPY